MLRIVLEPLQFPFIVNGLLEVVLLATAGGVIGAFVVERSLTFFAHALSHPTRQSNDRFPSHLQGHQQLARQFSDGVPNPMPPSLLVIDEDMRTRPLNSRLSFESHSIAAGRVPNLSTHHTSRLR
jgi:hypothetical protein